MPSNERATAADVEKAVEAIAGLLSDETLGPQVLSLVGERGWQRYTPRIEEVATDADAPVDLRVRAVEVLAQLGGDAAAQALEPLLQEPSAPLREAALAGAIRLQAWPTLKQLLREGELSDDLRRHVAEQMLASPDRAIAS